MVKNQFKIKSIIDENYQNFPTFLDLKSEMIICHHERIVSEKFDTYREEEEDKKFWMNLVKPSKTEIDIVSSIKIRLKIVETFIAIISLTSLIFTQFEYELEYSPKMIFDCQGQKPCNYQGNIVRVLVSIMCFFLALMAVYVSYLSYKMKKEQKKIINSKNKK